MKNFAYAALAATFLLAAALSVSVAYDFDDQTEYWTYAGGWRLRGAGVNGSQAAWGFNLTEDDFLASPGVELNAGTNYSITFRARADGSRRVMGVAVSPTPTLGADTLLLVDDLATDGRFDSLYSVSFTPPSTQLYHLVFFNVGTNGYRKLFVDDVAITGGDLNAAPVSRMIYSDQSSRTIAAGVDFPLRAYAVDNDGTVDAVRFAVDGQILGPVAGALGGDEYGSGWTAQLGPHSLTSVVTDQEGTTQTSFPLDVNVVPNEFQTSSYLGGSGDDDIRGSAILNDGTIVVAANLSALPAGVTPTYLNGAGSGARGALLRLNSAGTGVLAVSVVGDVVADLARDDQDRLYVAAGDAGLLRLPADLSRIDYAVAHVDNVHRVAAGPTGHAVILVDNETDYDAVKLLDARVYLYDPSGTELTNVSGATTFTVDVAIDETTQTIYSTGYKNFRTLDPAGNFFPVDVPAIKGSAYDGTQRFNGYNWSNDSSSPRWLNRPENNMADTRGARITVGDDGLLYVVYEVDGGNHPLRYAPFDIVQPVPIVGGDAHFQFFNSGTEPKTFVGRYDPLTGDYLAGQQFTARLTNTRANTVRTKNGDVAVNAAGEVHVVGESASGIPITVEHRPNDYRGGAFLLKLSADFTQRETVVRLTRGKARTVALGPGGSLFFAGETANDLVTTAPFQATSGGGDEGWFALRPAVMSLPVTWASFTAVATDKTTVQLDWTTTAEVDNDGFFVERSTDSDTRWTTISGRIPPATSAYAYVDEDEKATGRYYYRIRQRDVDGAEAYSGVRSVWLEGGEQSSLSVYPNPAEGYFTVRGAGATAWELVDGRGRVVRRGVAGRVEVEGLAGGVYYFRSGEDVVRVVVR